MTIQQRISVAGGGYCYTGPTCKLHGANAVSTARKQLRNAEAQITSAKTLNEFTSAQKSYTEARALFDSTADGQVQLDREIKEEKDPIARQVLENRAAVANKLAKDTEAAQQKEWEARGELEIRDDHTYDVPTYKTVEPGMYSAVVGSKRNTEKYVPVTEIAKNLRADIKEAKDKGYLPKNVTYSVSTDKYSGGQSIRIAAKGLKKEDVFNTIDDEDGYRGQREVYTEKGAELRKRLETLADAYNSKSMHGEIDYFNVDYHSSVSLQTEEDAKWENQEKERKAKVKERNQRKKDVLEEYKQARAKGKTREDYLNSKGLTFVAKTAKGEKVSKINSLPGYYAVESVGGHKVYDFGVHDNGDEQELFRNRFTPRHSLASLPNNQQYRVI
jgi:hypothetical protein